ncbi:MAG: hypothetical protein ACE5HO_03345 [bacterium]
MKVSFTKLICVSFCVALPSALLSQQQTEPTVRFELLASRDFHQPVKSWLFPPRAAEPGFAAVAVQQEQIRWFNGAPPKKLSLPAGYLSTVFSEHGRQFAVVSLRQTEKAGNGDKFLRLELYDSATTEKLYSLNQKQYFDDSLPVVVVSNQKGLVILGRNSTGTLRFYGQHGVLNKEVTLFPGAAYDLERSLYLDLSEDGTLLAVGASKRGGAPWGAEAPNPSGEPYLFLFTPFGEQLWSAPLPGFNTAATAISAHGEVIVANCYTVDQQGQVNKQSLLFSQDGKRTGSFDLLFKYAAFSPDAKYVLLAENNAATLVQSASGQIVWTERLPRSQGMIAAIGLSNAGEYAALLMAKNQFQQGVFLFTKPRVKVVDRAGQLQQEIDLEGESFEKPVLELSADHRHLVVGFGNSYRIYGSKQ